MNKEDHLDSSNSDLNLLEEVIQNIPGTNITCEDSTPPQKKIGPECYAQLKVQFRSVWDLYAKSWKEDFMPPGQQVIG